LTLAWDSDVYIAYFVLMQADSGPLHDLLASVTSTAGATVNCNGGSLIFGGLTGVDKGNSGVFFCSADALTFDLWSTVAADIYIGHLYFFTAFAYDCSNFSWPDLPNKTVKVLEIITVTGLIAILDDGLGVKTEA